MTAPIPARPPRATGRIRMVVIVTGLALSVVRWHSSDRPVKVLGQVEVADISAPPAPAASPPAPAPPQDAVLLDAVCITNTPAHDPC